MHKDINLITLLGPTASGKTTLAAHLSFAIHGEIISADSRQVYKELTIGSGKDYKDYFVQEEEIPVHLIDILPAGAQYNVYEFQKDFVRLFSDIHSRGKLPILCGGSGLYIEAVLKDYKLVQVPINESLRIQLDRKEQEELNAILEGFKQMHATTDSLNRKRTIRAIEIATFMANQPQDESKGLEINPLVFGIKLDRIIRRERITQRLKLRLQEGLVEEVKHLLNQGLLPLDLIYYGLEYKYVTQYVIGELSYDEMFTGLNTAIHQFAKRQMTWFRRMENKGVVIHWLDGTNSLQENLELILEKYKSLR